MGRVNGSKIKRMAKELVKRFKEQFGINFTANKQMLHAMGLKMTSKIELNKLAGYITVLVKKAAKLERSEEATA